MAALVPSALRDGRRKRLVAHASAGWRAGSKFAFGVFHADDGTLLGGAGLSRLDRDAGSANLGYWVASPHRGRGVATRAARLVARSGFEHVGLTRLEIVTLPDNHASQRVATRLGAARMGVVENRMLVDGQPARVVLSVLTVGARRSGG